MDIQPDTRLHSRAQRRIRLTVISGAMLIALLAILPVWGRVACVVLLGLEGVTEYLPVSSTGHLAW